MRTSALVAASIAGLLTVDSERSVGQQVLIEDQAHGQVGDIWVGAQATPRSQIVQSFTPTLSAIGFVQLQTSIVRFDPGSGGLTAVVQLREGDSLGPVIAISSPLFFQSLSIEYPIFYFSDNIAITANLPYYFQPLVLGGGELDFHMKDLGTYGRGDLFLNGGSANPLADLWFREGVVVPEPAVYWLLLASTGLLLMHWLVRRDTWPRRANSESCLRTLT